MNRWSRCWVICLAMAAGPALGAEDFDGTYTGKRVLTKGADRTCPIDGAGWERIPEEVAYLPVTIAVGIGAFDRPEILD